ATHARESHGGGAAERTTGAGPKQPARLAPALIWLFVSTGHERVLLRVIGVVGVHDRSLPSPRRPRRARRLDSADIRGLATACLDSVVGLPHTRLEHQDPGIRGSLRPRGIPSGGAAAAAAGTASIRAVRLVWCAPPWCQWMTSSVRARAGAGGAGPLGARCRGGAGP